MTSDARGDKPGHARHAHPHDHHDGAHAHPHDLSRRFDNAETWSTVFDDPSRDAWQHPDRVIAALALNPTMTVADVGAGTGYFTVRIAREVPAGKVIATDLEHDMMRYLAERARREGLSNIETIVTPGDDPKLDRADRVLVVDVWHHLDDRVTYARKLAAALDRGGLIAIVDYKLDAKVGPPAAHRLAPETSAAELRAVGLTVDPPLDLQEQYLLVARSSASRAKLGRHAALRART